MKMKNKHYFFPLLLMVMLMTIALAGCKKNSLKSCSEHSISFCSENPAKTNLRIKNNSQYNFCNVYVNTPSGAVNCGILKKGQSSCYRTFDEVYRYAHIKLSMGDKVFELLPFDYVGEEPLGAGNFTYDLDITDFDKGQLSITLKKD